MEIEEVNRLYSEGYDCAQAIIHALKDRLDADEATVMRTISCMGMGLLEGSVCGALLGAYAVIGLRFGSDRPDMGSKGLALIKKEQFMMEFRKLHSEITCPGIMGLDVRKDEDNLKAYSTGMYDRFCPNLCLEIINILERII